MDESKLHGNNLRKIISALEVKNIHFPAGKAKWNQEALNKLLSNEKYTGRVLLQKTVSTGTTQMKNDGLMERYLYIGSYEAIISGVIFQDVQRKNLVVLKIQKTRLP